MTVSIVETKQAFHELAAEWNALTQRCAASVFFRHEWFDAAWAWRETDSTLCIMLARQDGNLVGIFPLIRTKTKEHLLSIQCLEFLTVPDTQACDLIIDPESRAVVIAAFSDALCTQMKWDRLSLSYLSGGHRAADDLMVLLVNRRYRCCRKPQGTNLFVPLSGSWETYYAARTRGLKKASNLAANRLNKLGQIDIRWISSDNTTRSAIERALAQTIDISQRSWKRATGTSLNERGPLSFITVLTEHAMRNGWLSLWLLFLDGKALAMEYQLRDAGNVYALRADFDAECEDISPGSHLMRMLLETLFGRGLHRYYMGPGENAYKLRWTSEAVAQHRILVYGKTLSGRIIGILDDIVIPAVRTLRDKASSKGLSLRSKS